MRNWSRKNNFMKKLLAIILILLAFNSCKNDSKNTAVVESAPKKPNIIFIMSDDHAFQAISAYGHPVSQLAPTPNIDRIANNGMRMDRAYVTNSICGPSRAVILTGKHSHIMALDKMEIALMVISLRFLKNYRNWVTPPRFWENGICTAILRDLITGSSQSERKHHSCLYFRSGILFR